jgi:predicted TIM-barrel fold metal-dependent hydrolase
LRTHDADVSESPDGITMTDMLFSRRAVLTGSASLALARLASAQAPEKVIDTHAHIFRRGLPRASAMRSGSDPEAPVEDYLKQLDANRMTHGVLVQINDMGTDNSYIVDGIKTGKGRLKGIAVVDPTIFYNDMKQLDVAGIVGVRLDLVGRPIPDFTADPWPEHLKRVAALGWQVVVHREAKDLAGIVGPLLKAGVTVVVDHFGRFDGAQGGNDPGFKDLLTLGASRRLWVKLSAAYRNGKDGAGEAGALAAYPLLRNALGADRLLFGSDWPHTTFEKTINYANQKAFFEKMVPSVAERKLILGENAAKLFRF